MNGRGELTGRMELTQGSIVWGVIVRATIGIGDNCPGGNCMRGNCPLAIGIGGNYPGGGCLGAIGMGGNFPGGIDPGRIVLFAWGI